MNTDNADFLQRVGLVTYSGLLGLTADERALAAALADLGVAATAVAWDEARVDWAAFDGLVIRSTWNYHEQPEAFRGWLDGIEQLGALLWNAPQTIRWNMEKAYLRDLARQGVATVPTVWLEKGETAVLADILAEQGWTEAVVKPVISASAYETWLVAEPVRAVTEPVEAVTEPVEAVTEPVEAVTEPVEVGASTGSAADQVRFEKMVGQRALMVQQKMPIEQGEWSLVFLGGQYSHAVLKKPQAGDFRVQEEHGGSTVLAAAPAWMIQQAAQVLAAAAGSASTGSTTGASTGSATGASTGSATGASTSSTSTGSVSASTGSTSTGSVSLYARVDGVVVNGRFVLMELELIEPALFLSLAAGSAARFAQKIKQTINWKQ